MPTTRGKTIPGNESDYFEKIQIEEFKNTQIKLNQNDTIISQIDAVLNGFSSL
jgi:hypothetical protein